MPLLVRRPLPQPHVTDRRVMWRSAALVLFAAGVLTIVESIVTARERRLAVLSSGVIPLALGLLALRICPRLTPWQSYRAGRTFLLLSCIPVAQSEYNWHGTSVAGAMSFHYVLVILFAAAFFNPREVREQLAVAALASGVGLGAHGIDGVAVFTWLLTMTGLASVGLMVTELVTRMRKLSYGDALTGASNRRWWEIALENSIAEHQRQRQPVSVALIDIDHFKSVNDTEGHDGGDRLLINAVAAWRTVIRTSDELSRIGGDEFAVLLPGCDHQAALDTAQRLLSILQRTSGSTCSIGVATLRPDGDATNLVQCADRQLYRAKSDGRACVRADVVTGNVLAMPIVRQFSARGA